MAKVARLHDGTLLLRERDDGELVGDFSLRLTTPEGDETWTLGWGEFGPVAEYAGKGLSFFESQMRSWFDDHMYDLRERELVADRGYGDLSIRFDVPPELRQFIDD